MNKPFHKLAIGGPYNGQFVHWTGDLVEYPDGVNYRAVPIRVGEDYGTIYVLDTLTDKQALDLLMTEYLGI